MPPPPPPPPPSMPSMTNLGPSKQANKTQKSPDRNALLSDIRSGTRLKKAPKINDRSAPVIDGKQITPFPHPLNDLLLLSPSIIIFMPSVSFIFLPKI